MDLWSGLDELCAEKVEKAGQALATRASDSDEKESSASAGGALAAEPAPRPRGPGRFRVLRAREIAENMRIEQRGDHWLVPSQQGTGAKYVVRRGEFVLPESCTCPDYVLREKPCKHVHAVRLRINGEAERAAPGPTPTPVTKPRKSYPQDCSAYNAAQTHEKEHVVALLHDLCQGIPQPAHEKGRRPCLLSDLVFAAAMKVYGGTSGRRAQSDLRDLAAKGYMVKAPSYNSISRYLQTDELTPLLKRLVEASAAPLATVEVDFAVDSTGFSTKTYERYYDHKWGRPRFKSRWVKLHACVGVKTNVVTALEVTAGEGEGSGDCPHLPGLVEATAERFDVREVSADMAYSSRDNLTRVSRMGVSVYVPFKSNSKPSKPGTDSLWWSKLWRYFQYQREEFLEHYHKRSNVESSFGGIKRLFRGSVRAKKLESQINEVLLKCLVWNLTRLVHACYELGVDVEGITKQVG